MPNLIQASTGNGELAAEGARIISNEHRLLALIQLYFIVGNADNLRKSSAASGGTNRDLNNTFSGQEVDPEFANPSLKIFGDEVKVDQAHERRGSDITSVRTRDLRKFFRRMSKNLLTQIFQGTGAGTPTQMTGIKTLMPAAQKFWANSSSAALTLDLGNTSTIKKAHAQFKELLQEGIQKVDGGAEAIIVPSPIHHRIASILDDEVQYTRNEAGVLVGTWNGTELISAGYANDGSALLDAEDQGTITPDTYSVIFARMGEAQDLTFASSNGLNVTDKGLVGSHFVHNVEMDLEGVLENDKAVAELQGIELA